MNSELPNMLYLILNRNMSKVRKDGSSRKVYGALNLRRFHGHQLGQILGVAFQSPFHTPM